MVLRSRLMQRTTQQPKISCLHNGSCINTAERAYQELREDSAKAKSDSSVDVITLDLEQTLPTPLLSINVVFYKRQMWCYNLGVHDCGQDRGIMCMWTERLASRGSQEIGSCLLKFMQSMSSPATHLILYSDSCGGQNRNINIACLFLHVVSSDDYSYTTIDHKFMVSGHSYLPNDRDFASVENAKRKTQVVYVPSQWYNLVRQCRRNNHFQVIKMSIDDFKSVAPIKTGIVNRKVTTTKSKVQWLKMKWLCYEKSDPFKIRFRYSHIEHEEWKVLDVKRKAKGRPSDLGRIHLPNLRDHPPGLKSAKVRDLMSLLDYIPPVQLSYYSSLRANDAPSSDESSDEE